jgi:hypothetical protein
MEPKGGLATRQRDDRADEDDDEAGGRSSDLRRAMTKP